ncbi:MAG: hypothetical protein M1381_09695 [Deltaproteobacteria bacterium]|nr:hypothetical protein [Deltaproteobacteria bacterium]MCL5792354.1 hypothetical protein [Deltaproteobacteria bacterium]
MKEIYKNIENGLTSLYEYSLERFGDEMDTARKEFNTIMHIPPYDDLENQQRLMIFIHWFIMDRLAKSANTPAWVFYSERCLSFSYEEEALYRGLANSYTGIYRIIKKHNHYAAIDVGTGERFKFILDDDINIPVNNEILSIRFLHINANTALLATYCTHSYGAASIIKNELKTVNYFDKRLFSKRMLELCLLSMKSKKYNWIKPVLIYNNMAKI